MGGQPIKTLDGDYAPSVWPAKTLQVAECRYKILEPVYRRLGWRPTGKIVAIVARNTRYIKPNHCKTPATDLKRITVHRLGLEHLFLSVSELAYGVVFVKIVRPNPREVALQVASVV